MIHPTAIIDPQAELGSGVEIGPYSIIGKGVTVGEGTKIHNHVTLQGPTQIGKENEFFPYGSIGQQTQDLKYEGEPTHLEIGDHNLFREFVTLNRGTAPGSKTRIGSHSHFLAYTHIAHDCVIGDHCIFSNNSTLGGHVLVEDYVILGGFSGIHQFVRIGRHAMTGGVTKLVQDLPPYMIADGNPALIRGINQVGLQRRGFSEKAIKSLRTAYKTIYKKDLNVTQAIETMKAVEPPTEELSHLIDFVESSERGIVR
ncbi:MAG: acyl-ACP--UDP-N-acetylglucosamine O-acyltransferase [Verrucomicrobiota bacterium]